LGVPAKCALHGGDLIRGTSVAIFILLASCAMSRPQFVARQPVDEQVRVMTSFKTGIPETKTVGEIMIERVYIQTYPGFVATEDFTIPNVSTFNTSPPPVLKEEIWRCMQHITADEYACSAIKSNRSITPGNKIMILSSIHREVIGVVETFGNFIKFRNVIVENSFRSMCRMANHINRN
jgi:hypothetical protein